MSESIAAAWFMGKGVEGVEGMCEGCEAAAAAAAAEALLLWELDGALMVAAVTAMHLLLAG